MTISRRLYLNFGAILAVVIVLFLVNMAAVQREHATRAAVTRVTETARASAAVREQMMQNRLTLRNYLLSGDTREVQRLEDGIKKLQAQLHELATHNPSPELESVFNRLHDSEHQWEDNFARPLVAKRKQVDAGDTTVAELQIYYLQLNPPQWMTASNQILDEAEAINAHDLEEQRKSDVAAGNLTTWIALLSTILALVAGAFISYRTSNSITQPLEQLITVTKEIGDSGDLNHEIDIERQDEIGELGRSFRRMVLYLKEMAGVSEAIACGDLTVEVSPRSAADTLGSAFARMIDGLRHLVSSVRVGAAQVASGSNQVAAASDESARISVNASSAIDEVTSTMHQMTVNVQTMVKNTQVQASSVSETSASIDQMVASIQRVTETAKVLLEIAQRSREEVQAGFGTMEKATDGLNRINKSIQSSGQIISSLGHRADDIGRIVEVIDDLAEQTNLLALNAAIEAARAGEHGLGFAVVADEVRKLAEKSAQSTREISELIQNIQKEARRAVDDMEKSTSIVNEGLAMGSELRAALRKIATVVTEVNKFSQEIGAATNEQSHGSSQIARATMRLNEITHEISSAVEEQAAGTQAVVQAMERMRELVQRSTSGSTELAASSEQMSKMSSSLLDAMGRFQLEYTATAQSAPGPRPVTTLKPAPVKVRPRKYAEAARS